ncbi:MAG: hypothetical protein Q4P29_02715 [Tissierellia bacterium]|nr:hypothetical protein [Tissierellia bacterium]
MYRLNEYFSYDYEPKLSGDEIYELLTETSILEAEEYLKDRGEEISNIYFKLFAQILYLEENIDENKRELAYLYHLVGYYLGMFFHPTNGEKSQNIISIRQLN